MRPSAPHEQSGVEPLAGVLRGGDGALEVLQRLARGAEAQRARGGAQCVAPRRLPRASLEGVIGERVVAVVRAIVVVALERGGDRAMQRDAFAREQARAHGLAREGVAKREPVRRLLDDELRVDQLLHQREQLGLVVLRERLEQPEVEATSGHGGDRRDRARVGAQHRQSARHRLGGGARHADLLERACAPHAVLAHEIAGDEQGLEHLLDEERIALGESVQRVDEVRSERDLRAEDRLQHRRHVGHAERAQLHLGRAARAVEIGEKASESRADLVAPKCQHERDALRADASREMQHEVERRVVAPVHVLDHQEHRLRSGQCVDRLR